jgi:hypothetical protein
MVWFSAGALVLTLAAGLVFLVYGSFVKRRRKSVFGVSCALALLALLVLVMA